MYRYDVNEKQNVMSYLSSFPSYNKVLMLFDQDSEGYPTPESRTHFPLHHQHPHKLTAATKTHKRQ